MAARAVQAVNKIVASTSSLAVSGVKQGAGLVSRATPHVQSFWSKAKVELGPPSMRDLPEVQRGFRNLVNSAQKMKFLNLTVKEATANTLVAVEVAAWFYVGEIIGRGSLIGYNV